MLDPLPLWKSTLHSMPQVDKTDWISNFANWMNDRSTLKLELMPIQGQVMFNFNRGLFESSLRALAPVDIALSGAAQFANAWANAVMASQMVVLPGSCLGAPSPPTTWSVANTIIDIPSVTAARVYLMTRLTSASPVDKGFMSQMAEAYRTAFLMVTCTVTGINSLPIPSPLLAPFTPTR